MVKGKIPPKDNYNEASITRLKGLEAIRKMRSMYIGTGGINHTLKEITDNAFDEALAGHNDLVGIYVNSPDHFIYVWDNGRGIPIGPHPSDKSISTLTLVFTEVHTGGKIESTDAYKYSLGLHGVGASATNALSTVFEVYTYRNGWYSQQFKKGVATTPVVRQPPPNPPGVDLKLTKGTLIRFIPDTSILNQAEEKLNLQDLLNRLDITAYLIPNIKVVVYSYNPKLFKTYYHTNGIKDYIGVLQTETKSDLLGESFVIQTDDLDVVLQWSSYPDEWIYSYVNASPTVNGGTHLNGLRRAITDAITPHAGARSKNFRPQDLRSGLLGAINIRMNYKELRFDSQTKNRLISREAEKLVYDIILPQLQQFFNKNKQLAKDIIERANTVSKAHEDLKLTKELAAKYRPEQGGKTKFPIELEDCNSSVWHKRELYIVEGDSAGGTAVEARDRETQAIFKLTGKPPNSVKDSMENPRVQGLFRSLGWHPKYKQLRYGRIILLPDADEDGNHICCLLIALLHQFMPEVFNYQLPTGRKESIVYIVDAPLFEAQNNKGEHIYANTLAEISKKIPKNLLSGIIRMKGWAEANSDVLDEIAFNRSTRRLVRIDPVSGNDLTHFHALLGENVDARKLMLGI
jgi:DNA gyrase/topoisomerase IV subunit B